MSFNPYEILTNLRRNSTREPIRVFDMDKSNDNNLSVLKNPNNISSQSITINDSERNHARQPFSLLSHNIPNQPAGEVDSSFTKSAASSCTDRQYKNETFNQQAAIKLYKDKLVREVPELLFEPTKGQNRSIEIEDKENHNSMDYDLKIEITERNLEKLQQDFLQFKQDLKKELQTVETISTDRRSSTKTQREQTDPIKEEIKRTTVEENQNSVNVVTFKDFEKACKESRSSRVTSHIKTINTDRGVRPGALKLGPFVQLKKKFPQFPQCVVRVDLKEL